jgi:hypothetical protein
VYSMSGLLRSSWRLPRPTVGSMYAFNLEAEQVCTRIDTSRRSWRRSAGATSRSCVGSPGSAARTTAIPRPRRSTSVTPVGARCVHRIR